MWEEEYKQKKFYWGLKPNPALKKYIQLFSIGKALDIGAGEGRNSIFLVKNGFEVESIDKNKECLEKIKNLTEKHNLAIKTKCCDIKNFRFEKDKYSLVIATFSIDFLKKSEINIILDKIKTSLKINGFVYLSVFSIKDPMYKLIIGKGLKQVEKNTFYLAKHKTYRHFFTKKEIREKFSDFKTILLEQKEILDKGHGEPHYHNIIKLLTQKKKR